MHVEMQCELHLLYFLLLWNTGHNTGRGTPDVLGILLNGTVTGELATLGYVMDHHGTPALLVLEEGRNKQHRIYTASMETVIVYADW